MEPTVPSGIIKKKSNLSISPLATVGRLASEAKASEQNAGKEEQPSPLPRNLEWTRRRSVTIVTPPKPVSCVRLLCACCCSAVPRPCRGLLLGLTRCKSLTSQVCWGRPA